MRPFVSFVTSKAVQLLWLETHEPMRYRPSMTSKLLGITLYEPGPASILRELSSLTARWMRQLRSSMKSSEIIIAPSYTDEAPAI